jgi:hypothetical protein
MAGDHPFDVDFLAGAVMLVRRSAALAVGGLFDPAYFMFFEDSDLSVRLRRGGFRLQVVPAASAVHEYRHKAFKAGMMDASRKDYFRKRFPVFFRLSDSLRRMDRWQRPVDPPCGCDTLGASVASAQEFRVITGNAGVLAISPSMLGMPAVFRPAGEAPRALTDAEWALLEPAPYVVYLQPRDRSRPPRWVRFERPATPS